MQAIGRLLLINGVPRILTTTGQDGRASSWQSSNRHHIGTCRSNDRLPDSTNRPRTGNRPPRGLTTGRALIEEERLYRLRGAYTTSGYEWTRPRRSLRPPPRRQRHPPGQCRAGVYGSVLQLRLRPDGRSWALQRGRMRDALTRACLALEVGRLIRSQAVILMLSRLMRRVRQAGLYTLGQQRLNSPRQRRCAGCAITTSGPLT